MENLILNIVQTYLLVGIIAAVLVDVSIAVTKTSPRLTLIEITAAAIAWPAIAGSLLTKMINGNS
jgi:hypothetical protein